MATKVRKLVTFPAQLCDEARQLGLANLSGFLSEALAAWVSAEHARRSDYTGVASAQGTRILSGGKILPPTHRVAIRAHPAGTRAPRLEPSARALDSPFDAPTTPFETLWIRHSTPILRDFHAT